MKSQALPSLKTTMMLAILFFLAIPALASSDVSSEKSEDATTIEDVKEKIAAAGESIGQYTAEQRDQAVAAAQQQLDKLDRNIDMLEKKIDQHWNELSAETKNKWQDTLIDLKQKRIEAAEWYGGVKRGSTEAWEEIKTGYGKAYSELKLSWEKAKKEFAEETQDDSGDKK